MRPVNIQTLVLHEIVFKEDNDQSLTVFVQHMKSAAYQITAPAADYDCGKHSPSTLVLGH